MTLIMAFLVHEMSCSAGAMVTAMPFPALRCCPYETLVFLMLPLWIRTFWYNYFRTKACACTAGFPFVSGWSCVPLSLMGEGELYIICPCLLEGSLFLLWSLFLITSPGFLARADPVSPFLEMGKGGVVHSPLTHLGGMSPALFFSSLLLSSPVTKDKWCFSIASLCNTAFTHSSQNGCKYAMWTTGYVLRSCPLLLLMKIYVLVHLSNEDYYLCKWKV